MMRQNMYCRCTEGQEGFWQLPKAMPPSGSAKTEPLVPSKTKHRIKQIIRVR